MVFKNFRVNVIIRVLLLAVIVALLIYCLYQQLYLRSIYIAIGLILAIVEFIRYVDKTNRDYSNFLLAISQNDFTTTYSEKTKGQTFNSLYETFNHLTNKYRMISEEKEAQFIFLSLLIDHIRVGIISFDEHGHIHLINQTMKGFLYNSNVNNLQDFRHEDKILLKVFQHIKSKESQLVKVSRGNKMIPLTIQSAEISLRGKLYKLISAQDIRNELEANEIEAWQKLIRVLTHEIMNSVSPVVSLSSTLSQLIKNQNHNNLGESEFNALQQGLEAILVRSNGLRHFADSYRSLTRLPQPQFRTIKINSISNHLETLFKDELNSKKIILDILIDDGLEITADADLLEQVLINLLRNSIEATEQVPQPRIEMRAQHSANNAVSIIIKDNGLGISDKELDKIFIPFYTTKKNGSGIGLALSKQIIQIHRGEIYVSSEINKGCTVEIVL